MPEGVQPYPRWEGALSATPTWWTITLEEMRRAWDNAWSRVVILFVVMYAVLFIGRLSTVDAHDYGTFIDFLNNMMWASLAMAAILAGPSLLEDARQGALELYHSRGVTRPQYLLGKINAVTGLSILVVLLPGLVYVGASYLLFDTHPEGWKWAALGVVGYAAIWGVTIAGLGLGLSCIARSGRAASIVLFAGVAGLELVLANLLNAITQNDLAELLSPMEAMRAQVEWLFNQSIDVTWPAWYGLVELIFLAVLGWAIVAWKHPRIRGEERGSD